MKELFIGLISGTSVDAVDAVLVDLSKKNVSLLGKKTKRISKNLKSQILEAVNSSDLKSSFINKLDKLVSVLFAKASMELLEKLSIEADEVKAIGSHGQTIKHSPNSCNPFSLQLGQPKIISELTSIKTIGDFRTADINAGGQGAPLTPLFHKFILDIKKQNKGTFINIGGITNLTYVDLSQSEFIGYDCGPGNCLMDAWVRENQERSYDKDGKWASSGKLVEGLLDKMLNDKYFSLSKPKSTGPDYFNLDWIDKMIIKSKLKPSNKNVQATLLELTAKSIFNEIRKLPDLGSKIYFCGGGVHNDFLIQRIEKKLGRKILTTSNLGIDPDFLEATCFAWLAKQRLEKKYFDLSKITGSNKKVLLGTVS